MHTTAPVTFFQPAERTAPDVLARQRDDVAADPMLVSMLESFPEAAVVLNSQRQILRANARLAAMLNRPAASLVGLRLGEALACQHANAAPNGCGTTEHCTVCGAARAIESASSRMVQATEECRITAESDLGFSALDLRVWATPVAIGERGYLIVAVRDTSDEQRRRVLERMFFHDVLNAAGGLHGLLTLLPELPPEEAAQFGAEAGRLSGHVVEEIEAHRDLTAVERGELAARREPVYVSGLLADLATLYAHHPVAVDRTLVCEPPSVPMAVTSDPVLLRRVLGNLIKNALEATPAGGTVRVRVTHEGSPRFEVHNASVMPEAVRLQVFQRSFSTKGGRGRGVGTYSARLLVERCLGGTIGFRSTRDEGTTFWVNLPSA